eukprot:CAMPEP_0202711158 /NCGR_PEP_ID=MMETSP1385-20130828/23018_1 /ASSEMBLY_ACC=CAM_ASM_000861 /TAXON_ID=933848 /ORGANISM="Elphidium margaritaceum" /LENGTH=446 /DNA_ID=CAMNT_0049370833 /DNA_START=7 /DNA_END=1344 /DNA_ORIENTATION=-
MAQPLPRTSHPYTQYPSHEAHTTVQCAATTAFETHPSTLRYIEQEKPLSDEHCVIYHRVRVYVDDILARKKLWKLTKFEPHLLSIVDHNFKHNNKIYATEDMYEYLQQYATTSTLVACCIGSDFEWNAALQCVLDTVQWRVCSKIDDIQPVQFKNALQTNTVYNIGEYDKMGHPICHFRILSTLPDDPWMIVRAAVFSIEKCVRMMAKHRNNHNNEHHAVYQLLWLLDLEHLSYTTMPPLQVIQQVNTLMTQFYPERLYKAYLLFTPWIFSTLFAVVSPVLPIKTQQKLVNVGFAASSAYDTFKHEIDARRLLKKYGGQHDRIYDYQWECEQFAIAIAVADASKNKVNESNKLELDDKVDEDDEKKIVEETEEKENQLQLEVMTEGDVKEEVDGDDDDSMLCIVCLDGARDHVLIPCGHIAVCGECKKEYNEGNAECPLCRQTVQM